MIDPTNNDMFTIFNSVAGAPILNNKIYKNSNPYSSLSIIWNTASSFTTMRELENRPYLQTNANGETDNSANIFALNANYLFYWDGKNLKAFNKATGASVGTPYITTNTAKMCGGIYADNNNLVYVGDLNSSISAFLFTGTNFFPLGPVLAGSPLMSLTI